MLLSELDIKAKSDDIYNLSLRNSALRLCADILANLTALEQLYMSAPGSAVYNRYLSFVRQNRQVELIIDRFGKNLGKKQRPNCHVPEYKKYSRLAATKTLVVLISDILTLASIAQSDFMLNKLMLCCNSLSKQLLFLYEN